MGERTYSFGYWLRRRRKALDLTQEELAQAVSCSRFAIRKIEADERRPSRGLAERLAERLAVPAAEREEFLEAARALRSANQLQVDWQPLEPGSALSEASRFAAPGDSGAAAVSGAGERTPMVGRVSELGQLTGLLARLTSGVGHAALIEGEPGIGKSRLLREIVRYASGRGIRTLATNCYEIERAMPYQPVIDLVGQAVDLCQTPLLRKLPAVALAEIAALVPAVSERISNLPALSVDFPEARQARLFHAIVRLLDVLAHGRQLVIAVDDVQWLDGTSRQFLHYFARHLQSRPVLLLLAYRDEEVSADESLGGFVESLRREAHARHFPLARLSLADAEALLGQLRAPDAELSAWLHRESEGNPLFMTSILHALEGQDALAIEAGGRSSTHAAGASHALPEALLVSVRTRVHRVPREVRAKLEIAAVLGRRFDFELLQAVTREPQAALLDAIDALVKRQLLREEPEGGVYDFSHDKVREVVYLDIGSTRRMLLHRTVAEAMERSERHEGHERIARLAEHYERGQVWSKAVDYMLQAAEQAQRLFAMREALGWIDRAIALVEAHSDAMSDPARLALIERRGAARAQAGQTAGAVADIERVMEAARDRGETQRVRDLLIELGMAYRRADAYDQAAACLTEALAASRTMHDERHAASTLYHLGTVAWSDGHNRDAIRFHQEGVEICERLQLADLVAVQAFHGRGEAHFANAEPGPAIECYARSLRYARGIADKSYESENLMMMGWASTGVMGLADYPQALEYFESALEIAQAADLQWHLGPTYLGRDHVRACLGQYRAAWAGMNETLRRLEELQLVRYRNIANFVIGHLLLDLNRNARSAKVLERALANARTVNAKFWQPALQAALALARLRAGELSRGEELEQALRASRQNSERYMEALCLGALSELQLARGEAGACLDSADRLLELAEANAMRELTATALRLRGEASIAQARFAPAQEALTRASALAERIGRPRLSWEIYRSLARLAERTGAIGEADRHRAAAHAIAARIERDLGDGELSFAPAEEPG